MGLFQEMLSVLLTRNKVVETSGDVIIGIQGVIVALLIPLGIEIINDLRKSEDALQISFLNKSVIRPVGFALSVAAVSVISLVLIPLSPSYLLWIAVGILFLYQALRLAEIYKWIMPPLEGIFSRDDFRKKQIFEYLSKIRDTGILSSYLERKLAEPPKDVRTEKLYSTICDREIARLSKKSPCGMCKDKHRMSLLNSFVSNIDKRDVPQESPNWIDTLLRVFKVMDIVFYESQDKALDKYAEISFIHWQVQGSIVKLIGNYCNKSGQILAHHIVFGALKRHLSLPSRKDVAKLKEIDKKYYSRFIQGTLMPAFLNSIFSEKSEWDENEMGAYYPTEWRITEKSLEDNIIALLTWRYYWNLFLTKFKFVGKGEEENLGLSRMSDLLFPELEPVTWACIQALIYSLSFKDAERELLNKCVTGYHNIKSSHRPYSFSTDPSLSDKDEGKEILRMLNQKESEAKDRTYKFAIKVFKNSIELKIKLSIEYLDSLTFDEAHDSDRSRRDLYIEVARTLERMSGLTH
jgi:hypothetical protein